MSHKLLEARESKKEIEGKKKRVKSREGGQADRVEGRRGNTGKAEEAEEPRELCRL